MHPSVQLYCTKSTKLKGKRIVLGVTGSISATETVKLSRELIRHGAEIYPVMSPSAQKIISPDSLWFASGNRPIVELDGSVQHVSLCGEVPDKVDLMLIAPCTANTISKIAYGIDDTPVTTFATTALGSNIPLIIAPSMHISMYKHPVVTENIEKLKNLGIEIVEPILEENKAKFPEIEELVEKVIRKIGRNDYKNKKLLIIAGSTVEPVDEVRVITNRSSGKTGIELAKNAFERGAKVELWLGNIAEKIPDYIPSKRFETVKDLIVLCKRINYDIVMMPAAISDYTVEQRKGKLPSNLKELKLTLKPNPKVIDIIRKNSDCYLVGFKAEVGLSKQELIEKAYERLRKSRLNLIVANDIREVRPDESHVFIINRNKKVVEVTGTKSQIAERILDAIKRDTDVR